VTAIRALPDVALDGTLFSRADVSWREVGGEVAVSLNGNVELLPVKARSLWRLLDSPQTFQDLVARVAAVNGSHPAMVLPDVAEQLDVLVDRGLLEVVADTDD
jgi:hypothetical protein